MENQIDREDSVRIVAFDKNHPRDIPGGNACILPATNDCSGPSSGQKDRAKQLSKKLFNPAQVTAPPFHPPRPVRRLS